METVDQATSVCGALHGQHWPPANPKTLSVNYSTTEDVSGVDYELDVTMSIANYTEYASGVEYELMMKG